MSFPTTLRRALIACLILSTQGCKEEIPTPIPITKSVSTTDSAVKNDTDAGIRRETRHIAKNTSPNLRLQPSLENAPSAAQSLGDNTTPSLRDGTCTQVVDVYYNLDTGEVLKEVIISTDCGDTGGDGGGSPGGGTEGGGNGGSGGSGGGATSFPTGIDNATASVEQTSPTLGNYAATLAISPSAYQVINVKVELDTNAKDLKKVVVSLNGIVWFTTFTQVGDGTLTSYNSASDTYSFQVSFQKNLGGYWSNQTTIFGTISPSRGVGTLTIP